MLFLKVICQVYQPAILSDSVGRIPPMLISPCLQVLFPTCGSAYPGECLAILGPSGAGKSTALDILSLRKTSGKITGEVCQSLLTACKLPCMRSSDTLSGYLSIPKCDHENVGILSILPSCTNARTATHSKFGRT